MRKLQICLTLLTLSWLISGAPARALPEYPKYLQSAAETPCLPHCNVCHRDDAAGSGTVDRPFGKSMEDVGSLQGGGQSDVARAVDTLRSENTDSDGDGLSDIDELHHGEDPNYAGAGSICGPEVGCSSVRTGRTVWSSGLSLVGSLALALWFRRTRTRARLRARPR